LVKLLKEKNFDVCDLEFWNVFAEYYDVEYSNPLLTLNVGWSLGDEAREAGVTHWSDLDDSEYEVGVGSDSFSYYVELWVNSNLPHVTVVKYEDLTAAGYALHTGKIDAVFGDSPSLGRAQKQYYRAAYQGSVTPYSTRHLAVRADADCDEVCSEPNRSLLASVWEGCA
jgi:ABC-type amino acid transport substrate-binding protein